MFERHVTICEETTDRDSTAIKTVRISEIFQNRDVTDYYRSIFNSCDSNKNGQISLHELKEFLTVNEDIQIPDEVVQCIQRRFDRNQDEELDFEEFLEMINHPTFKRTFKKLGSRYLKFVAEGSVRMKLRLRRTVTNTGRYEEEFKIGYHNIGLLIMTLVQVVFFYTDLALKSRGKDRAIIKALRFEPKKRYEIWRYLTQALCHKRAAHLYGNVVLQLLVGFPLEIVHSWRVLLIFVAGSIGGCLVHSIKDNTKLYGASGGVYSFCSAHIASVILNWSEMSHPAFHLLIFGFIVVFDVGYKYYLYMDNVDKASYSAHLGGAVVGLLLGVNVLRNLRVTKKEKIVCKIFLISYTALMTVLVVLNIQMAVEE